MLIGPLPSMGDALCAYNAIPMRGVGVITFNGFLNSVTLEAFIGFFNLALAVGSFGSFWKLSVVW